MEARSLNLWIAREVPASASGKQQLTPHGKMASPSSLDFLVADLAICSPFPLPLVLQTDGDPPPALLQEAFWG